MYRFFQHSVLGRHFTSMKWMLLFVCISWFSSTTWANSRTKLDHWKTHDYLEFLHYARVSDDTTQMKTVLIKLEENLFLLNSPELLKELHKTLHYVESRYPDLRYSMYAIYKKHYTNLANTLKIFEFSYKMYKSLDKGTVNDNVVWNLIDIGNIFFIEKDYKNAKKFYDKAYTLAQNLSNNQILAVIFINYSLINEEENKLDEAIKNYQLSFKYRKESGNVKYISFNYVCVAQLHLRLGNPDSCLYYIRLAEEYYYFKGQKTGTLVDIPALIYEIKSDYAEYFEDYKKSLFYNRKAQRYCIQNGIIDILFDLELREVDLILAQKLDGQAMQLLERLYLKYIDQPEMLTQYRAICEKLAKLHKKKGNLKKANEFITLAIEADKKIDSSEQIEQLGLMGSILNVYENEMKLSMAQKEFQIQKVSSELRKKERKASLLIGIISSVLVVILIILFILFQRNRIFLVKLQRQLVAQTEEERKKAEELLLTNQLKDKLFSIIAHDLRNPLNRLLVELAIVRTKFPENETVNQIEQSLKETITLFEEFLVWSRLYNNKNAIHLTRLNACDELHRLLVFNEKKLLDNGVQIQDYSQKGVKNILICSDYQLFRILLDAVLQKSLTVFQAHPTSNVFHVEIEEQGEVACIQFKVQSQGIDADFIDYFNPQTNLSLTLNSFSSAIYQLAMKMSGWNIASKAIDGGAEITVYIPIYRSSNTDSDEFGAIFNIPEGYKDQLSEITKLKFYQISQIRDYIKLMSAIQDEEVQRWLKRLEEAINESNEQHFIHLMDSLK